MATIDRREFLSRLGKGGLGALGALYWARPGLAWALDPAKPKLNFVFVLIDDLGARDLACYGSTFYRTPNVDKLAAQGMEFSNAYAACPVCSPTRASILTGRYPARLHYTYISGYQNPKNEKLICPPVPNELPLDEVTIAEALKAAGYVTGSVGKWHLGGKGFMPQDQGFDFNFGGAGGPGDYFSPYNTPFTPDGPPGEFLTERLTREALRFLDANKDKPFFLYFAHYTVHASRGDRLQARKEVIAKYKAVADPKNPQHNATYAAMVESMDDSVGQVLAKLDQLGIADRTAVIFMSDNGGYLRATSNAPLRAGKGSLYEGGIREPLIVRWPGLVKPGSTCDTPVTSVDFFPTMLDMAGRKPDPHLVLDGTSFVPLLTQSGIPDRDAIYWHCPHYYRQIDGVPSGAVRQGDYKLIEFYENGKVELYDVARDISEKHDLSAELPEKTAELKSKLEKWLRSVDAAMPVPNPAYVPPTK